MLLVEETHTPCDAAVGKRKGVCMAWKTRYKEVDTFFLSLSFFFSPSLLETLELSNVATGLNSLSCGLSLDLKKKKERNNRETIQVINLRRSLSVSGRLYKSTLGDSCSFSPLELSLSILFKVNLTPKKKKKNRMPL